MLVQRSNGELFGNMRNHDEKNLRAVATSAARGRTWTNFRLHPALISPVCQAGMTWYDQDAKQCLLFSNPADTERRNMTVRVSLDEGDTWPIERVLHAGPAAYSSIAVLPDGEIGIFYERGDETPYDRVTFAKFPLQWLID